MSNICSGSGRSSTTCMPKIIIASLQASRRIVDYRSIGSLKRATTNPGGSPSSQRGRLYAVREEVVNAHNANLSLDGSLKYK